MSSSNTSVSITRRHHIQQQQQLLHLSLRGMGFVVEVHSQVINNISTDDATKSFVCQSIGF